MNFEEYHKNLEEKKQYQNNPPSVIARDSWNNAAIEMYRRAYDSGLFSKEQILQLYKIYLNVTERYYIEV